MKRTSRRRPELIVADPHRPFAFEQTEKPIRRLAEAILWRDIWSGGELHDRKSTSRNFAGKMHMNAPARGKGMFSEFE